MKSRCKLFVFIPVVLMLAACSATPKYVLTPDYEYMRQVEHSARYHGNASRVYWVNPPLKRELREDSKLN